MDKLQELIFLCKASILLNINEHKNIYQSVQEYLNEQSDLQCPPEYDEWVKIKMIETNTIIELQFYPDTPIGFYYLFDYDLDRILTRALNILKER